MTNPNLIYLQQFDFAKQLDKLKNKLKNKKILLYGAGEFLSVIKQNYSLDSLNIIGIADRKFVESDQEFFEGYKVYTPDDILELKPDYVLITTKIYVYIIENLITNFPLFSKIKLLPIVHKPSKIIFKELLEVNSLFYYLNALKRVLSYKIYEKFNLSLFVRKTLSFRFINDFFNIWKFKLRKPTNKTVLLIEINSCHGETMPSVYKYFSDLGYNVDIIANAKLYDIKAFNCIKKNHNLKVFPVSLHNINKCVKDKFLQKYDYIFYNSCNVYKNNKPVNLFDFYPTNLSDKKIGGFVHRMEVFKSGTCKPFILANLPNDINAKVINPHYFGKIKTRNKNKLTNFIIVGDIKQQRKNYNLLLNAIEKLNEKGTSNYKITVIGRGELDNIPEHLQPFFDIKGRLTYTDMYKEMEKSDFFLPLLDPNLPDHDRYITTGTSGSFQLIYGFCKPCIIQEKFAKVHGFNNDNSFVYSKNDDLALFMENAINLSQNKYSYLQNNLQNFSQELYKKSLDNLKNSLNIK